ncbi:MAG: hypothetical protein KDJ48_04315, partial [Nitratireductor sp.]|nr:hypothetical protein [Nitratireductor sp.]
MEYEKFKIVFDLESGVFRNSSEARSAIANGTLAEEKNISYEMEFNRLFRKVSSDDNWVIAGADGYFAEKFVGANIEWEKFRKTYLVPGSAAPSSLFQEFSGITGSLLEITNAAREPVFIYGGYPDGAWEKLVSTKLVRYGTAVESNRFELASLRADTIMGDWRTVKFDVQEGAGSLDALSLKYIGLEAIAAAEIVPLINSKFIRGNYEYRTTDKLRPDPVFLEIANLIRQSGAKFLENIDFSTSNINKRNCGSGSELPFEASPGWKRNFFGDAGKIWVLGDKNKNGYFVQEVCYQQGPEYGNDYSNFYFISSKYPDGGKLFDMGEVEDDDGNMRSVSLVGRRYNQEFSGQIDATSITKIGDNRHVLLDKANAALVVFDNEGADGAYPVNDLPKAQLINHISQITDERHLLQQNSDGTFYVHRIADGETVLEGRIVDDEVIVWTPDMRFDSTAEGAHFVNLRFPGQIGQYT